MIRCIDTAARALRLSLVIFLAPFLLSSPAAHASMITQGKVLRIVMRASDGLTYVIVDGTRTTTPTCATQSFFVVKELTSESGKAQLAMLMTSYSSGRLVAVYGSGTCTRYYNAEDLDEFQMLP